MSPTTSMRPPRHPGRRPRGSGSSGCARHTRSNETPTPAATGAAGIAALDELNQTLASNRCRLKTTVAVEEAAGEVVGSVDASRWVGFRVEEYHEVRHRQETRGRPGANTRYRQITRIKHRIHFDVREDVIWADARSDGCWPLITNEKDTDPADVLAAYKHLPSLERRHHQLKGDQLVAPMFLHDPARIEGLMTCHFIALLVHALVELEIRRAMAARGLKKIPLYPEHRACTSPSAVRIFEIFDRQRSRPSSPHRHQRRDDPDVPA